MGSSLIFCTTLNTNPITYCPLSITFCAASLQQKEEKKRRDEHQCKSIINSESRVKSQVSLAQPVIKRQTNGLIIKVLQEVFSNPASCTATMSTKLVSIVVVVVVAVFMDFNGDSIDASACTASVPATSRLTPWPKPPKTHLYSARLTILHTKPYPRRLACACVCVWFLVQRFSLLSAASSEHPLTQ